MNIIKQSASPILEKDFYKKIERCGRICYKSEDRITDDSAKKFCEMLLSKGHLSVFEHWRLKSAPSARALLEDNFKTLEQIKSFFAPSDQHITLHLVSSIQVLRQLFRHRRLSISQESTRYCRYKDGITVVEPMFEKGSSTYWTWHAITKFSEAAYLDLLREGAKPEVAAAVLPLCTKSEAAVTASFDEWDYILNIRTQSDVFPQTRELAEMIKNVINEVKNAKNSTKS